MSEANKQHLRSEYLNRITGDIWYYETIVLLASVLDSDEMASLMNSILTTSNNAIESSYRALLAAESLQSSVSRNNAALNKQVFDALRNSILNKNTADSYKVECWQTLGRLQLKGIQLSDLPLMIQNESRFVREEAINIVSSVSEEPISECRLAGGKLIWMAAKFFALDRLRSYKKWVFSPALRSPGLIALYLLAVIVSLIYWLLPLPASLLLTNQFAPLSLVWWAMLIVGIEVLLIQIFLWLNEDKRSLYNLMEMFKTLPSRLRSRNQIERFQAVRFICLLVIPQLVATALIATIFWKDYRQRMIEAEIVAIQQATIQKEEEAKTVSPTEFSKLGYRATPTPLSTKIEELNIPESVEPNIILAISNNISTTDNVPQFLISKDLISEQTDVQFFANNEELRNNLVKQLRELSNYVDTSNELNYKLERRHLTDLILRCINGEKTPARDIILKLRRDARQANSLSYLRFDDKNADLVKDVKEYPEQLVLIEIEFLNQSYSPHSYLQILRVNGIITSAAMDRAEDNNDESWFAEASKQVLVELKNQISADLSRPIPRVCVRAAFEGLEQAVGNPAMHDNAVKTAIDTFNTARDLWISDKKEREESFRRAQEAKLRAEQARAEANEAWFNLIKTGVLIVFVLLATGILVWKYIVPRIQLSRLDASLSANTTELLKLARDHNRDMSLRKAAIRKLARSDDSRAIDGINSIILDHKEPEAIRTEANRALHQIHRRNMRRTSSI